MINEGDVILCKTASIGKTAIVSNLHVKTTINPQLIVFKNSVLYSYFLGYLLKTNEFQNKVKSLIGQGSIPNISQTIIGNIFIKISKNYNEQIKIGELFSSIDTLITLHQRK
jgi:type I restriction enzyme S subunit